VRGFPLLLSAILLAACGGNQDADGAEATRAGVERANADIRAAEAATRAPVSVNRSVAELTGKPVRDARDAPTPPKAQEAPAQVAEADPEPTAVALAPPPPSDAR
jgi:arginase family enzyme